jgi:hypothetical protein
VDGIKRPNCKAAHLVAGSRHANTDRPRRKTSSAGAGMPGSEGQGDAIPAVSPQPASALLINGLMRNDSLSDSRSFQTPTTPCKLAVSRQFSILDPLPPYTVS